MHHHILGCQGFRSGYLKWEEDELFTVSGLPYKVRGVGHLCRGAKTPDPLEKTGSSSERLGESKRRNRRRRDGFKPL